jgi:HupE / UreJ protein
MRTCEGRLRTTASYAVLMALALGAGAVQAHEIGTTRVVVSFARDGAYRIDVATDAVSLLERLEVAAGDPRSSTTEAEVIRGQLLARAQTLRQHFAPAFDGVRAEPEMHLAVAAATDVNGTAQASIQLAGRRPAGSRQFTWSYSLTSASYALSVLPSEGSAPLTQWLEGGETSTPVPLDSLSPVTTGVGLAMKYVALGFTHIIPGGIDHVMFVLGIFLLSRKARPVLLQVSAFTVAHSITLGLSMYGIVSLPSSIVEPLIAFSIAYIAIENVVLTDIKPSRVGLVFAFGLLHGLGFAGALREVGLPRSEFVTALLGFNVGVEIGQLMVIGAAFVLVGYKFGDRIWYRRRVVLPASACIACFGVVWTLQRLHLV